MVAFPTPSASSTVALASRRGLATIAPGQVAFARAAPVPGRSVLKVTGRDAPKFLNGLAAVRIPETFEGRPFYGAFLHAQGRILHDTFIYPHAASNAFLIDHPTPSALSPPLREHLRRFVLRAKVGLKDVSDEFAPWAAWGHPAEAERALGGERSWKWGNGETAQVGWEVEPGEWPATEEELGAWDARAPGMGWRGLVRAGATPSVASGAAIAGPDDYLHHRLVRGVAEGPEDLVPMTSLPSESNLDFMGGVDFRKGCYVGQELTVRTYHTGQTRKRILPIELYALDPSADDGPPLSLPSGSNVQLSFTTASLADGPARPTRPKASGRLLTNVNGAGLALLRLEQVDAVWRGDGVMSVKVDGDEGAAAPRWGVRPRAVDWWPVRPPPAPAAAE